MATTIQKMTSVQMTNLAEARTIIAIVPRMTRNLMMTSLHGQMWINSIS